MPVNLDTFYGFQIRLEGGRISRVVALNMNLAYADCCDRRESLKAARNEAPQAVQASDTPVFIVEPDVAEAGMPPVVCTALLESKPISQGSPEKFAGSALTVVWFQSELAFPPPQTVVAALKSLTWEALAQNFII